MAHRHKVMDFEVELLRVYDAVEREQPKKIGVVDGGGENEQELKTKAWWLPLNGDVVVHVGESAVMIWYLAGRAEC